MRERIGHELICCCLVALAGCSGAGTRGDGGAGPGGGALDGGGAGSDFGGVVSDLAALTTRDLAPASGGGPCPAYVGSTRVGAKWVYDVTDGDIALTETSVVTAANATGSTLALTVQSTLVGNDSKGNSYDQTVVEETRCDATGYLSISESVDNHDVVSGTVSDSSSLSTYSPPLRGMPADLHATPSWTTAGTVSTQDSAGTQSSAYSYSYTVGGTSSITVPAGTFDVIAISVTSGATTSTTYYAAGVGVVSNSIVKLVSYAP